MKEMNKKKLRVVALATTGRYFASIISSLEILETAAEFAEHQDFMSHVVTPNNRPLVGRAGLSVQPTSQWQSFDFTNILIIGSIGDPLESLDKIDADLFDWIKEMNKKGSKIVAIDTGIFLVAKAGLLRQNKAVMHSYFAHLFRELFPEITLVTEQKTLIDGNIYLSSGPYSHSNVMLEIVEKHFGKHTRNLGNQFLSTLESSSNSHSYCDVFRYMQHKDELILKIQKWILTIDLDIVTISDLANEACLSERQLKRRFKDATSISPLKFIQLGRLSFAKELLSSTKLSIDEVASRSGYVDTRFFRQIFKRENDCSPLEYRKKHQIKV
ncbi:AraC family transcriptional regulator [Vibrio harveyi]|uniref:GlxA family transcriptional regulator n=1 Tax=Vibrio harveyi TaxID=669 RepID=UPI001EFE4B86|nr:helix-turn-helix domain-containing protein [Vibrio harveyi]MCG9235732.1 helix-turn-helix domain-containing protein [Vibrio harveyi]MCG9586001.1 helix-turn-helix domain-containing protein [Vibrio harveyi]CAH1206854.1 AraC family transcriptional regulator [Vibrio harveyi]CAH1550056.1 AraC family transcriptional regulator [Vibrio harveyi]CAH1554333.1 AraC family transcriptional regulator [Vibrio harveyi]